MSPYWDKNNTAGDRALCTDTTPISGEFACGVIMAAAVTENTQHLINPFYSEAAVEIRWQFR